MSRPVIISQYNKEEGGMHAGGRCMMPAEQGEAWPPSQLVRVQPAATGTQGSPQYLLGISSLPPPPLHILL